MDVKHHVSLLTPSCGFAPHNEWNIKMALIAARFHIEIIVAVTMYRYLWVLTNISSVNSFFVKQVNSFFTNYRVIFQQIGYSFITKPVNSFFTEGVNPLKNQTGSPVFTKPVNTFFNWKVNFS